mmetsp:Transcript_19430/g.31861  ORF Transcript_19430/g.31861 Transcript_19430/m.31861 type:complete len:266 (-) Transcript_19430:574-1371(-)
MSIAVVAAIQKTSIPFCVVVRLRRRRRIAIFLLITQKNAPTIPPNDPITTNIAYSHKSKLGWSSTFPFTRSENLSSSIPLNTAIDVTWKACPLPIRVIIAYIVITVTHAERKHRQVSRVDQKLEPSSIANRIPEIGERKAAATPAAQPTAAKSIRCLSVRSKSNFGLFLGTNLLALSPIASPKKIIGPSNPAGRPAATEQTTDIALQRAVDKSVQSGTIIPFKTAFASAMPLPPETGAIATGMKAIIASATDVPTCWKKPRYQLP